MDDRLAGIQFFLLEMDDVRRCVLYIEKSLGLFPFFMLLFEYCVRGGLDELRIVTLLAFVEEHGGEELGIAADAPRHVIGDNIQHDDLTLLYDARCLAAHCIQLCACDGALD